MMRLQNNKIFRFFAVLVLLCLSAAAFHSLAHAAHSGDTAGSEHCAVCQFVTIAAAVVLCALVFFHKLQREQFDTSEQKQFLPAQYLSAVFSRGPPLSFS